MAGDVPVYESQGTFPESTFQPIQGVTPPQFDAGALGREITGMGDAVQKFAEGQEFTRFVKARTAVATGLEGLREQYSKDPDFQTAPQRFQQDAQKLVDDQLGTISDPKYRAMAQLHMTTELLANQRHVIGAAAGAERNFHLAANDQNEADSVSAFTQAQSDTERAAVVRDRNQFIDAGAQSGWINPREAVDYKLRFGDKVAAAQKDATTANLIDQLSLAHTHTLQGVVGLDPNSDEARTEIERGVGVSAGLYGAAVKAGAISQTTAVRAIQDERNGAWGDLIVSQAGRLSTPDQVATYRQQFDADFAAGKYDGRLDAAGYLKVQASLARQEKQTATAAASAGTDLRKSLDDFVTREAHGLTPQPGEWNQMLAAAHNIPGGDDLVAYADAKRSLAARLTALPVDQADTVMRNYREDQRAGGGVSPASAGLIAFGDKLVGDAKKQLGTDMLGYGQQRGLIKAISPLDLDGAMKGDTTNIANGQLTAQIRDRATQATSLAGALERTPQFFRPDEKTRLKQIVDAGGDAALGVASSIVSGGGDSAMAMLKQLGDEAPRLAQAGMILNAGGSLNAARDVTEFQRMKASGATIPDIQPIDKRAADQAAFGTAYSLAPAERMRVAQAADAIARVRLVKSGADPSSGDGKAIYARALQEAAGAVFVDDRQYGGMGSYRTGTWPFGQAAQVVVPAGVRADRMRDLFGALTDDDLKRLPNAPEGHASDLASKIPLAVPGGYAFATKSYVSGGDLQVVRGRDGKPWTLDWSAVEPDLRRRVPDAFIGAR